MRLQAEYIKRHDLNILPIYHVKSSSVILKLRSRPQVVLYIEFNTTARTPGYYTFNYLTPNHNGCLDGNYFLKLGAETTYQYEEYLNFIFRWAKNLEFIPIKISEVKLAIWEMFLYCFDGWIIENNLEAIAYNIVDLSLTVEQRLSTLEEFLNTLAKHYSLVGAIYDAEFRKFEHNYADWLTELIDFYNAKRRIEEI